MGIPKFYRWTSERYPCLSERIKEYQIPEFDNLYLDMNGIIHNCSHPNDEDVHLRIPEKQMFKDIFHYIDFLFKMIKPCKVFFMAIDGVAPRAKMNQQRGRRFRSAKIAEDQEQEAIRKGEVLPSEDRFDSNCITPGTEFMARLNEQLKYFVQVKVSTDPLWQRAGLVIYLSGHDVPGEGEHKIMDFIRHQRSQPDYEPVRHCLYGLDADLVMLGLSTHELQFSLLREEVKFSRPKKPRRGEKKPPPKPNSDSTSYDLTNVSIFKNENGTGPSTVGLPDKISAPAPKGPVKDTAVREGQSFLEMLGKPAEPPVQVPLAQNEVAVNKEANEDDIPPPPEDPGAKGVYKAPLPEKTTFLLLHLSLMRDYIDFEFQELKKNLTNHRCIEYDIERVIDDWILMNILVGNDFVPHLPHFHIVKGALPMLYRMYTEILPTLDGYINENGHLNLPRFEKFLRKLSQFDIEMFRETYDDMKYMESKTGKNIVLGEKMFEGFDFEDPHFVEESLEPKPMSPELQALAQRTEEEVFGDSPGGVSGNMCVDVFGATDDYFEPDDSPELKMEFLQHKRNYYISKLERDKITPDFLDMFCKEYIRAIQWVLLYYYKGVSSWGWFYPFHYGPFCSDLKNFADYKIEFDLGQPFRPFEQLLGVLPAQSKKFLPACYQWLMTDEKSPIKTFYPEKFEQDLNGKKQDWEAVVLIPFIDELKLLKVMEEEEAKLTAEEKHRNARGTMQLCSYTLEDTGVIRSARDQFPELKSSHVKIEKMYEVTYDPVLLPKGIHPKSKKDSIYQGFPTLKSKPVQALVEKAEIKVFDFVTREESMVLSLEHVQDDPGDIRPLARKLIGRSVWVNWPHMTFAYVTAILTPKGKLFKDPYTGNIALDQDLIGSRAEKEFANIAKGLVQRHLKCKGIKLGELNVILFAKMMEGRKVSCGRNGQVQFETLWSNLEQPFALKTSMYEENVTEIFYLDRNLATTYLDMYKIGDNVFYMGDKFFGAMGTVCGHEPEKTSVTVDLKLYANDDESNLRSCVGHSTLKSHDFFSSYEAAGRCQLSSYVLSRITGCCYVSIEKETRAHQKLMAKQKELARKLAKVADPSISDDSSTSEDEFPVLEMRKVNIGLDLKFNKKNLEVRGYTSKRDGIWYYSDKAIQLVNDFVVQFYDFVNFMTRAEKGRDGFDASEIFPDRPLERINEIVDWLDEKGVRDLPRIPTNTKLLDDEDIDSIWQYILKHKSPMRKYTKKRIHVAPNLILKPGMDRGCVPPIPNSEYSILDRVVCIDRGAPIPVGGRGTVVGLQVPEASEPEQIEESFKSTGAATLMTLIILCDPDPDVFDDHGMFGGGKKNKDLSGALQSLLRISEGNNAAFPVVPPPEKTKKRGLPPDLKPRLIKLYPYQVLNVTQGPENLKQGYRDSKEVRNLPGFQMNGHCKPPPRKQYPHYPQPQAPQGNAQPLRLLLRNNGANQGIPIQPHGSQPQQVQIQKRPANNRQNALQNQNQVPVQGNAPAPLMGDLPWPPTPRMQLPTETFSALLQQTFNVGSTNPNPNPANTQTANSTFGPVVPENPAAFVLSQAFTKRPQPMESSSGQDLLGMLANANNSFMSNSTSGQKNSPSKPKHDSRRRDQPRNNSGPPPPPSSWIPNPNAGGPLGYLPQNGIPPLLIPFPIFKAQEQHSSSSSQKRSSKQPKPSSSSQPKQHASSSMPQAQFQQQVSQILQKPSSSAPPQPQHQPQLQAQSSVPPHMQPSSILKKFTPTVPQHHKPRSDNSMVPSQVLRNTAERPNTKRRPNHRLGQVPPANNEPKQQQQVQVAPKTTPQAQDPLLSVLSLPQSSSSSTKETVPSVEPVTGKNPRLGANFGNFQG